MKLDQKRWLILLAGILANLCQGTAYASSVFAVPVLTKLGLLIDGKPDISKWALAFSVNLACLPIGMLLSGKIADMRGPRVVVAVAGSIFALGMFLAGCSNTYEHFLLTFGVMMGIGSGAAYGAVVSTSVRWFPERRGLAAGISVGALGLGTMLIAPIALALLKAHDITFTLRSFGLLFLVVMILTSLVMTNPPAGYCPAGFTPKAGGGAADGMSWTQMIRCGRFWLLFVMYACGAFAGLMIISQAKQIGGGLQGTSEDSLARLTAWVGGVFAGKSEFPVGIVAFLGLTNALGRIFWGFVSDKMGRVQTLATMSLLTAVSLALIPGMTTPDWKFVVAILMVGLCYGGYLGIFPSLCADAFGAKNLTVNYAVLFSSFSVAAIAGPYVAAAIKKATGNYNGAFQQAATVAVIGLLVTLVVMALDDLVKENRQLREELNSLKK